MVEPTVIEFCAPGEVGWSYAQKAYRPPVSSAGRPRSSELMRQSLDRSGLGGRLDEITLAVRREFGLERTVWGVKSQGAAVSWELYWYDHSDDTPLTLERVRSVFEPTLRWPDLVYPADRRVWSISVDVDERTLETGEISGVHLYAPRSTEPPTCVSYRLDELGLHLENTYFLFVESDMAARSAEWMSSSLISARAGHLLDPATGPWDHVALAHKPACDGVYLGGVSPSGCASFFGATGAPGWMVDTFAVADGALDHLLIDVGADVALRPDGRSIVSKWAFHGVL